MVTYAGLRATSDSSNPHVGGNIFEGDPFTHSPSVWDYLIKRFALSSVLDIGSGMGYAARYFHQAGMRVLAVDGMKENCVSAVYPTMHVDLTQSKVAARVDLVHCQEVVEHIEEKYLDNLLSSLTSGRFIVMTNAVPGQGGHHHVNEQPTEYWIEHLKKYNCEVMVEDSNRIRRLAANDGAMYLANTGLVLVNKGF
jgi:hypothetical protein